MLITEDGNLKYTAVEPTFFLLAFLINLGRQATEMRAEKPHMSQTT
jgi:hypothetical protein